MSELEYWISDAEIANDFRKEKFTETEEQVFNLLISDPSLNHYSIAKTLGISNSVLVSKAVEGLKKKGILRSNAHFEDPLLGTREITETEAIFNPSSLNLTRANIICTDVPEIKSLHLLEAFAENYPYIHYHANGMSDNLVAFFQIDIPQGSENKINILFEIMKEKFQLFDNMHIFSSYSMTDSKINLVGQKSYQNQFISLYSNSQKLSPRGIFHANCKYFQSNRMDINDNLEKNPLEISKKFDLLDLKLIREINVNSKIAVKELAEIYGLSAPAISNRLKKIRQNHTPREKLLFDKRSIYSVIPILILGTFRNSTKVDLIKSFIQSNSYPFQANLLIEDRQYIFYTSLPYKYLADFVKFIWLLSENFHQINLQHNFSKVHYLNFSNYDERQKKWYDDYDYLVENSIQLIEKLKASSYAPNEGFSNISISTK